MAQGRGIDPAVQGPGGEALQQLLLHELRQPGTALREGSRCGDHSGRFARQRTPDPAAGAHLLGFARELVLQRRQSAGSFGIPDLRETGPDKVVGMNYI